MKIVRIGKKKYVWDVEKMHPVAFWMRVIGGLLLGSATIYLMMALPIVFFDKFNVC